MVFLRPFYLFLLAVSGILDVTTKATPEVVTSFTIPNEWVGRLTGGQVAHSALIPSGGELHGYQLSTPDARLLSKAKLIVGINPELEPWLADWVKAHQRESAMLWLSPGKLVAGSHTWIVPAEVRAMVQRLTAALKQQPTLAGLVTENNIHQVLTEVSVVDYELRAAFAKLPPDQRAFITQHPGIEAFAQCYGLRVAGTILDNAAAESADPSARHFAALAKIIRTERIRVITCDAGQSHRLADQLARDTQLAPPTELCFEYLQRAGTPGDTWATLMRLNAQRLCDALQTK